ncbi:hypothetical protein J2Z57_002276 [Formosa algae]|uniref:Uncharacterized protein n=2 Tax=Formosa algae TaxID=225843 RepID=A0A9X0YJE5_9FLAO|nr:hypothetical protein [Formosa algae]MDQ0335825.1 hypothetical protein [Formosa algae]
MRKTYLILIILIILSVSYLFLQCAELYNFSNVIMALVVPFICVFYLSTHKNPKLYFTAFLTLFSLAHILAFFSETEYLHENLIYFLGNFLYISAYMSLIFGVFKGMYYKDIIPRFNLTIIILLLLNSYVLFSLVNGDLAINSPSTETVIGAQETSKYVGTITLEADALPLEDTTASIVLEFVYNLVILILLNVAFINYLYKDNTRSFFLFIGALCVFFSEIIQYVTRFPSEEISLNIICFLLIVSGFMCFYLFAIQNATKNVKMVELD